MKPIIHASVEEAVEDLTTVLPFLRIGNMVADSGRGPRRSPEVYRDLCRILEQLENPERLRERLRECRRPDGTVVLEFSPEAAALFDKRLPVERKEKNTHDPNSILRESGLVAAGRLRYLRSAGEPRRRGLVIWSEADPPKPAASSGLTKPALHVHAGDCDQSARERLDPPVAWEYLDAHLTFLVGEPAEGWRSTFRS
jgi:hypothetical protein